MDLKLSNQRWWTINWRCGHARILCREWCNSSSSIVVTLVWVDWLSSDVTKVGEFPALFAGRNTLAVPTLHHYFLLLLLLFLLPAASRFCSPNNTICILYCLAILCRKPSLDPSEPLVECRFTLPRDALVLVFVNHTRTNKHLFSCFIVLLPLSCHCLAVLHILSQKDPCWLLLVVWLNSQSGHLFRPLAENSRLCLFLRSLMFRAQISVDCILTSRHAGKFYPWVYSAIRLCHWALLIGPCAFVAMLFSHKPSSTLLASEFGRFFHGLVLESVENGVQLARLILLLRLHRSGLDLIPCDYGRCVSNIWGRILQLCYPFWWGHRIRIRLHRVGCGLKFKESRLLWRVSNMVHFLG